MSIRQISANVFVETGLRGANLGLIVTPEGLVAIDTPQKPSEALAWRREVEQMGRLRYLIYTDCHIDHTTGGAFMPPAIVVSHKENRKALQRASVAVLREMVQRADPVSMPLLDNYAPRLPDVTYSERSTLYLGGETIELWHLPGHVAGGTGVCLPRERVMFTGDVIFHGVKSRMRDATPEQWRRSLDIVAGADVKVLVPGHGDVCDKSYLGEQKKVVQAWADAVSEAIRAGWSLAEAKERLISPDPNPLEKDMPVVEREMMARRISDEVIERLYRVRQPFAQSGNLS